MIGPDKANRLLTLIVEAIDSTDDCLLITGWQSNAAERTLFSRPGGTKHAR